MNITLAFIPADSALSSRIRGDLEGARFQVVDAVQPGRESLLVLVLSPQAVNDPSIQQAMITALDHHQHIIPVLAAPVALPPLINNLQPLNFSQEYHAQALLERIGRLSAPDAPPPLTVLTPSRQAANRRAALFFLGIVALIFISGLVLIGTGFIRAPEDEFAGIETQIYLTQRYFIDRGLPRSTEQAAEFAETIEHIPTRARVQLIQTATAVAAGVDGTFVPRSTEQATHFAATLKAVSTIVQMRLADSATQAAATAALITPTPG